MQRQSYWCPLAIADIFMAAFLTGDASNDEPEGTSRNEHKESEAPRDPQKARVVAPRVVAARTITRPCFWQMFILNQTPDALFRSR